MIEKARPPSPARQEIPWGEVLPGEAPTLELQGIPRGTPASPRIHALFEKARDLLARLARPAGIHRPVERDAFQRVLEGSWAKGRDGEPPARTPVEDVHRRASHRALFAVTLGPAVDREIRRRFEANDAALGAMLDAAASIAADRAAAALETRFARHAAAGALRYSPGYCGWHVRGQRALFAALRPETIGVTLRESCLMDPLKSVSGVLLAGPREIHAIERTYPCCETCETHACGARWRELRERKAP